MVGWGFVASQGLRTLLLGGVVEALAYCVGLGVSADDGKLQTFRKSANKRSCVHP